MLNSNVQNGRRGRLCNLKLGGPPRSQNCKVSRIFIFCCFPDDTFCGLDSGAASGLGLVAVTLPRVGIGCARLRSLQPSDINQPNPPQFQPHRKK